MAKEPKKEGLLSSVSSGAIVAYNEAPPMGSQHDEKLPQNVGKLIPSLDETPPEGMSHYLSEMEDAAGQGLEEVKASDLALPFLKLVQSSSPEAKRGDAAYVKGAVEGLWLDTISRRLFRDVIFVPAKYVTHYLEWDPNKFGHLIKNHGTDPTAYNNSQRDEKTGADLTPEGNVIVPTATWFGILLGGNEVDPNVVDDRGTYVELFQRAVITMAGTAQKVSRRWVSDADSLKLRGRSGNWFTPPLFSMSYCIGSVPTKNDQGNWVLPTATRAGWTLDYPQGKGLFDFAKEFSSFANEVQLSLVSNVQDDRPSEARSGGGTRSDLRQRAASSEDGRPVPPDDDIPF